MYKGTKNLKGVRFGRITVTSSEIRSVISGYCKNGRPYRSYFVDAICDCGTILEIDSKSLESGNTTSCGCYIREIIKRGLSSTHGMSKTREYRIWQGMISRCENPNATEYHSYGAMGIAVCERWRNSFLMFYEDMGPAPTPKHTIDRFPNKGGNYGPDNCRWATMKEQNNNRKSNYLITYNGKTQSIMMWCEELKIASPTTVYLRIWARKWDPIAAITTPKISVAESNRRRKKQNI
jgi:hypothetical protein